MSVNQPATLLRPMLKFRLEKQMSDFWRAVAPGSSVESRSELTSQFLSRGGTTDEIIQVLRQLRAAAPEEKYVLGQMISEGFLPEQLMLFAQSTSQERAQLAQSWVATATATAHRTVSRVEKSTNTLALIGLGSVTIGSLVVLSAGLALQDPAVVETSAIATRLVDLLSQDGLNMLAVGATQVGLVGTATAFSILLLKVVPSVASEIAQEPVERRLSNVRRDLEDRVAGVFRRMDSSELRVPGGMVDTSRALMELSAIPTAYTPLLTHLHPKELVVFLDSAEDVRSDMMRRHPPSTEQRMLTGRALASGRLREFSGSLQQALSSWQGGLKTHDAVTLGKTMAALRQARQESRHAGVIPAARPRFGPATS